MKKREFIKSLFGVSVVGAANLNVKSAEIESLEQTKPLFNSVELQKKVNAASPGKRKFFFAERLPTTYDKSFADMQAIQSSNMEVPVFKLGMPISDQMLKRHMRISESGESLIGYWENYYSELLKIGMYQKMELHAISALFSELNNEWYKPYSIKAFEGTADEVFAEVNKNSHNYTKLVAPSRLLKDSSISELAKIVTYDETYWTKSSTEIKEKHRFLQPNEIILANIADNPEDNRDIFEFKYGQTKEETISCLRGRTKPSEHLIHAYYELKTDPPEVRSWAVTTGYVKIYKPENFMVFRIK